MAQSYESRYSVDPVYIPSLPSYKGVLHSVQMSGGHTYSDGHKQATVCYCPYLIVLFRQRQLPVWDSIKRQATVIDGGMFYEPFDKGFADGIAYFDQNYHVPPTVLYSSSNYIETVKRLYYGDGSQWPEKYCLQMSRWCPITLERSLFREIGYWSGLTFRIEEVMNLHPSLFERVADLTPIPVVQPATSDNNTASVLETYIPSVISTPKNEQNSWDDQKSLRKARKAVTLFECRVEEIVKQENGKISPKSTAVIVKEALVKYIELAANQHLAITERSLNRYLKDIGIPITAKRYGGQLVRQYRKDN